MKILRGELKNPENDDCRVLAPFVMTLFDGEADEIEARRARAHLLVCQTCANRWLDWNRSRDLLLHSAPVPAPPPQLLWRVLMACRLSKTPQRAQTSAPTSVPSSALSAQIFARTTRTALPIAPARAPRRMFAPLGFSTFAAPALCIWMLLLQRDVWLVPVSSPPRAATSQALERESAPRAAISPAKIPVAARNSRRNSVSRISSAPAISPPAPVEASVLETPQRRPDSAISVSRLPEPIAPAPLAATQALRVIEASLGAPADFEMPGMSRGEDISLRFAESEPLSAPRRAPRRASQRVVTARAAALSISQRAPRLRAARLASAAPLPTAITGAARFAVAENLESPQTLRLAVPSASAPQPARLLAEFDADDERIEEARSVVDEFRAAVDPEENGAETALDDENTG